MSKVKLKKTGAAESDTPVNTISTICVYRIFDTNINTTVAQAD